LQAYTWPSNVRELEHVIERAHIIKVLESVGWRMSGDQGAAVLLGVPATTLRSRMERLGIQKPRA
jgi:transcriptional regulator with GAF, ATPase, and Fis domain